MPNRYITFSKYDGAVNKTHLDGSLAAAQPDWQRKVNPVFSLYSSRPCQILASQAGAGWDFALKGRAAKLLSESTVSKALSCDRNFMHYSCGIDCLVNT
jgi:hypothetical protein